MAKPAVLVVDDDPAIQRILVQTLELEEYEVRTASDGVEALEAITAGRPDVVILDVMMPKMDGFSVLKRIRADPATSGLPVVLLTAKSSQQDVWEGWQQGVDYYMSKPFDVEELLRFIRYILSQEHEREEPEAE